MEILSVLTVLFGIAGFAGGAVGYFAKGRAEAVIALSAKEIELLKDANSRLEKENVATIAERDRLKVENDRYAAVANDMRENTKAVRDLIIAIKSNTKGQ